MRTFVQEPKATPQPAAARLPRPGPATPEPVRGFYSLPPLQPNLDSRAIQRWPDDTARGADGDGLAPRGIRSFSPAAVPPSVAEVLAAPGQPLAARTRAQMERRFGHDFSRVRVHADAPAAASARALQARAYTVGQDVVFAAGRYRPGEPAGDRLLAHELVHTLQQRAAPVGGPLKLDTPGSPPEQQARQIAATLVRPPLAAAAGPRPACAGQAAAPSISGVQTAMLQRDAGVCEPAEATGALATATVIDYENQVCRPAEPDEIGVTAPETDPVDGDFWILPEGVRAGARPVFDEEDTQVVVAFRYSSGGYYEVYDLQGRFVESGEPGLERPLIDPIDLLAGGLVGLGRGLLGGGARAAVRGAAGRGAGAAVAAGGLRASISLLSRSALTAVRAVYRGLRFRGALNFTATTAARMANPARRVPQHILKLAIRFGTRSPDPQGVAGAFRYVIPLFRNGRQYTLEVVIREADNTVLHFLYR